MQSSQAINYSCTCSMCKVSERVLPITLMVLGIIITLSGFLAVYHMVGVIPSIYYLIIPTVLSLSGGALFLAGVIKSIEFYQKKMQNAFFTEREGALITKRRIPTPTSSQDWTTSLSENGSQVSLKEKSDLDPEKKGSLDPQTLKSKLDPEKKGSLDPQTLKSKLDLEKKGSLDPQKQESKLDPLPQGQSDKTVLNQELIAALNKNDRAEIIECIDQGADVNTTNDQGESVLFWALDRGDCLGGTGGLVGVILEKGANPHSKNKLGESAIAKAREKKLPEIVRILVEKGVDVNTTDADGITLLLWAINQDYFRGDDLGLVNYLLQKNADPNKQDRFENAPLKAAVMKNVPSLIQAMIQGGAVVDIPMDESKTFLLLWAIKQGYYDGKDFGAVGALINGGANVLQGNTLGETPLSVAMGKNQPDLVHKLVEFGANPNSTDDSNSNVILWALQKGHYKGDNFGLVGYLLERGANPSRENNAGMSALTYAESKRLDSTLIAKLQQPIK